MKMEITSMIKCFNNVNCKYYYELAIEAEERPNLKMGTCEVVQK